MRGISRRNLLALATSPLIAGVGRKWVSPALAASARMELLPGPRFFVKGVYQQPVETMALWKSRGVNTIFTVNGGGEVLQWTQEALRLHLNIVREPRGWDYSGPQKSLVLSDRDAFEWDLQQPLLLAFSLIDEPSNLKPGGQGITYEGVTMRPDQVDEIAKLWGGSGKPLWINHIGSHINNMYLDAIMADYADSPYIDWLCHDSYPVASGEALVTDLDDYVSTPQGHAIDRLLRWSGGRPQFSFVGTSQFNGSMGRNASAAEFGVQAWSSIIHGAVGIIYFTFAFSPAFAWDATPPELVDALVKFNSEIDDIEHILIDAEKGGRRPSIRLQSVREPAQLSGFDLPYPFEGCSIPTGDGDYRIILNLSDKPADLTFPSWGLSKVAFDGYQCRRGYTVAEIARG
ncbi:hypothetical protein [Sinorhizobium sp. BG8]|uniref:hypothetical protein n=1 Tax=Sinorhizobium sp. BG8 TaxID=2613773 RepID=UPI00193D0F4F|nr:hypothetical protein [Sinorhizobium sp. BG8]QRM53200.1 hypothetical protein F3Y30_00430 [Sinorhizobium sp. BG8]